MFTAITNSRLLDNDISYKEKELLLLVSLGDESAFSQIYHTYSDTVFNTVMTYLNDETESQEIVQRIFIKLWEHRDRLAEVRSLKDYLFISTRNAVFHYFNRLIRGRQALEQVQAYQQDYVPDPAELLQEKAYRELLEEAIQQLPPQQQQAYILIDQQECSYEEAAEKMQLSKGTVKKHVELARRFVRTYVSEELREVMVPLLIAAMAEWRS